MFLIGSVLEDDIFWKCLQNLKELVVFHWGHKLHGTKRVRAASEGVAQSHWPLEGNGKPRTNMILTSLCWYAQPWPEQWAPVWMGHQREQSSCNRHEERQHKSRQRRANHSRNPVWAPIRKRRQRTGALVPGHQWACRSQDAALQVQWMLADGMTGLTQIPLQLPSSEGTTGELRKQLGTNQQSSKLSLYVQQHVLQMNLNHWW